MSEEADGLFDAFHCVKSRQDSYVAAWTTVCRLLDEVNDEERQYRFYIEVWNLRMLHGDPNKPAPTGVIDFKEKK